MEISIALGNAAQRLVVPDGQMVGVSVPKKMQPAADPAALVHRKVVASVDELGLAALAGPASTACIAVTDRTRSTPLRLVVPILLDQLQAMGVADGNVTVISAGGMHAADSREDLALTLGPAVLDRVQVCTNEPDNKDLMVLLGTTKIGTPVEVHRCFAEADIKVGVTNVNPCMLAGWSGSGKIVMPGVSSRRSIYHNHKQFTDTLLKLRCASLLGIMPPENVVRDDIEDCATVSGINLVVNTVLDSQRQLVDVFCGGHLPAHRAAMDLMLPNVEVSLPQPVDVMVAGVGDPALEVSLFQGGSRVCGGVDRYLRPGGTLIMANACTEGIYEGFEHEEFREWMRRMPTPVEIGKLVDDGEMGGEKGCVLFTFSWLLHEMECRIVVVTGGMSAEELKEIHLEHAASVQEATDAVLADYNGASVGAMPYGGLVLPTLPA